jgi:MFS family permease
VRRRWGFGVCFVGGLVLVGVALLLAAVAPSLAAVAAVAVCYTFGQTAHRVASVSIRQELVPDHLLGRVTAAFRTLFLVPGPLGALAEGGDGERSAFAAMGAFVLLLAALALLGPARARHPTLTGPWIARPATPPDSGPVCEHPSGP